MRVQKSNSASVMNALRDYGDRSAALLLISSSDDEIHTALQRVFQIHEAPVVSLEEGLAWDLGTVGDCVISKTGVVITVEGSGDSFMGLRFETFWGEVDKPWHEVAEQNGCVWLALVEPGVYGRIADAGNDAFLPAADLLKLEFRP